MCTTIFGTPGGTESHGVAGIDGIDGSCFFVYLLSLKHWHSWDGRLICFWDWEAFCGIDWRFFPSSFSFLSSSSKERKILEFENRIKLS